MIVQRLKNLWAWSAYTPMDFNQDTINPTLGTITAELTEKIAEKVVEKGAKIISYKRRDPVAEIVNQDPHEY